MAATKRKRGGRAKTSRASARGSGSAKTRKTARRKSRPRTERIALTEAPARTRDAILAGIRRLLRKHGVDGDLVQLQIEPRAARATAAANARLEAVAPCPDGQTLRVVCFFQQGTFVCEEQCVPA